MKEPMESLLARLKPQLRLLASRSGCAEVSASADDLINELIIRLSKHPSPSHDNVEAYVVKSFKNLIRDHERKCNRRAARDVEYMCRRPEIRFDGPERRAIQREQRSHIKRAIRLASLRRDYLCAFWAWVRSTLLPRHHDTVGSSDPLTEFANRRGIAVSTARVWALRARKALLPHLNHLCQDV